MKMKASVVFYALIMGLFLVFSYSCEKDEPKAMPVLSTTEVTEIEQTTAVSGGNISDDGGAAVTARGVCWSTNQSPSINDSRTSNGSGTGTFNANITSLVPNTTYYVRAYATNSVGTSYGSVVSFTTQKGIDMPTLTSSEVTKIEKTTAVSGGNITDDGGALVTARGVCWSTSKTPTISDSKTEDGTGSGSFISNITDLEPSTTYHVRAYATNSKGTGYGTTYSFKTLEAVIPTLTTTEISEITQTTAVSGGDISNDGSATVIVRGVCWSTKDAPTIDDNKTENGNGTGTFISNIAGLEKGTTYYVRAYATNSKGTSYGKTYSFKTLNIPTLTTKEITGITQTTAVSGGNISDDGGAAVTARGVCWSTNQSPNINDSKTSNSSGKGSFNANITNLVPNTTYYVRAYATNSEGTGYGTIYSFKTLEAVIPTLTTTKVSEITQTTAFSGGDISNDGGEAVTARGVCWSTKDAPTIDDNKTEDGNGIGTFISNIAGLEKGTNYYVRAYATNSKGTSYGNTNSFKTLNIPTLTTKEITGITQTTAVSGGNISDDGGAAVTARGVCWSTNQSPNINDSKTNNGSGKGSFYANITNLVSNTTYYVRSYATNSEGTAYGSIFSFTTFQEDGSAGTFTDSRDGNVYKAVIIGNQVWMAENLKYLPSVVGPATGSNTAPYYYVYDYNGTDVNAAKATANYSTYGVLYNWPAAMAGSKSSTTNPSGVQGVCPDGWHLPSDAEWDQLIKFLGKDYLEGAKLKETGTTHWKSPNTAATNEKGFTALPGGGRYNGGAFFNIGDYGHWWSAAEYSATIAWTRSMSHDSSNVYRSNYYKEFGFSVRCVRD